MALGAFEAFTVVLDDQRFLACRTNQDVEKVLRNHTRILRSKAPNQRIRCGVRQSDPEPSLMEFAE
jgi:hypothetical protein